MLSGADKMSAESVLVNEKFFPFATRLHPWPD